MKNYFLFLLVYVCGILAGCSEKEEIPELSIPTKDYDVSVSGGIVNVSVVTNQTLSVSIPSAAQSWIHSQVNDKMISLTIDANEEYEQRSADVIINGGTLSESIHVAQAAKLAILLSKDTIELSKESESFSIDVSGNVDYEVVISADWIKLAESTRGLTTKTYSFTVDEMEAPITERVCTIEFVNKQNNISEKFIANQRLEFIEFEDEYFSVYMISLFDVDKDGKFSVSEVKSIKTIDCSGDKRIRSLKGIEYCENLTSLTCSGCQLSALDVSKNVALNTLDCSVNLLTSLDVSKNTELECLKCFENQLTSLDVSSNIALKELTCSSNRLSSLDVSNNTMLEQLACGGSQLTSLDVSNNTMLEQLACGSNQLSSIDVSNNPKLSFMACNFNQLTTLDLSNNPALTILGCIKNKLVSLNVSKNTELKSLYCDENFLTSLDLSANIKLSRLWCTSNQLTVLDLSNNTELEELSCWYNPLSTLILLGNHTYETLSYPLSIYPTYK